MKKILVTTDFSSNSRAGIRFALQLASQTPCELIFYYVNKAKAADAWTQLDYNNFKKTENTLLDDKLEKFISKIYSQTNKQIGKIECVVESSAKVDESIINYAQKCNADYICMSTRGGGIIDKFIGTNASALITSSSVPIIVVPHSYRSKLLKSVLYASDLEKIGIEIKSVEKFANTFDAKVVVYHYDYFIEKEDANSKLNKIATKYSSATITFRFRKLNPELTLLSNLQQDIRKSKPSIIAMFTKQDRSWFERLFLSSKTAELGFDTKTPMLVFRKQT